MKRRRGGWWGRRGKSRCNPRSLASKRSLLARLPLAFTGPVWKRSLTDGLTRDGGGPQNLSSARGEPAGGFTGDMHMISLRQICLSYAFETSKIRVHYLQIFKIVILRPHQMRLNPSSDVILHRNLSRLPKNLLFICVHPPQVQSGLIQAGSR